MNAYLREHYDFLRDFFGVRPQQPAPAPKPPKVDYNQVRSAVIQEIIRRKSRLVRLGDKTYRITATQVEVTR